MTSQRTKQILALFKIEMESDIRQNSAPIPTTTTREDDVNRPIEFIDSSVVEGTSSVARGDEDIADTIEVDTQFEYRNMPLLNTDEELSAAVVLQMLSDMTDRPGSHLNADEFMEATRTDALGIQIHNSPENLEECGSNLINQESNPAPNIDVTPGVSSERRTFSPVFFRSRQSSSSSSITSSSSSDSSSSYTSSSYTSSSYTSSTSESTSHSNTNAEPPGETYITIYTPIYLDTANNSECVTQEVEIVTLESETVAQEGEIITQEGEIITQEGEIITHEGEVITQEGEILTHEGEIITHGGEFITHEGEIITHEGEFITHEGEFITHEGEFITHEGEIITHEGEIITHKGEIITHDGEIVTQESETIRQESEESLDIVPIESEENSEEDAQTSIQSRKRKNSPHNLTQNKSKIRRTCGLTYKARNKPVTKPKGIQQPCNNKCKFKCYEKFTDAQRQSIFNAYWDLRDIDHQRSFILSCMTDVIPEYSTRARPPQNCNKAFSFIANGKSIRVCKQFFVRTLNITDRVVRTVREKSIAYGLLGRDLLGRIEHHRRTDVSLLMDITEFINSIPRIMSRYTRQSPSREYIYGWKSIKELYVDFQKQQARRNKTSGKYCTFRRVVTEQLNISLFMPRKDQCDLCLQYQNSNIEQKGIIQEEYDIHTVEKRLSRLEKNYDRSKVNYRNKMIVIDLQSVLQSPKGVTSASFYTSKLNSYNFTATLLEKKLAGHSRDSYSEVHCYVWNECDARRGSNEIGSCLLKLFENLSAECTSDDGLNLILYSDNYCGHHRNKFLLTIYLYAVAHLNIQTITHKYLIQGHTQHEGHHVHSIIKKEISKNLKSGPIYSPQHYVEIIKNAKKCGNKFNVHEQTYESFLDLKKLQKDWGYNFNRTVEGKSVTWSEIKMIKVKKSSPFSFFVKSSYTQAQFVEVCTRNKRKKMPLLPELIPVNAYSSRQELSEKKKKDLRALVSNNLIPNVYKAFYDALL